MKLKSLALAMSGLLVLSGCGGSGDDKKTPSTPASETPVYSKPAMESSIPLTADGAVDWHDVGVHDPSIVKADSTYYIFGTHLGAAKSDDLINWTMFSSLSHESLVNESELFANKYTSEIAEGIAWTDGYPGNWAADVIQAPNGKYWFYFNHCGQNLQLSDPAQTEPKEVCHHRSYLGLAEADSVDGAYVNKGIFLRSGYRTTAEFNSFPLDNNQTTYEPAIDPNVIDPAAFYDKNGNLWMVYGSYSGGIFILEMDRTTGKPKAGQGYGKHLLGGDFRAVEGSFVIYSPVADYYYLFYSVAGFAANDGYNIRIARSKKPQGPYLDPAGNDVANAAGLEIGAKLLGGFEFTQSVGDVGASWGYQSPGHNSAYYDAATKRHLLITHTRFPATATAYPNNREAHAVRTHEMFVNKEGWLVVSPQRYVPLNGDNVVDPAQIPGYYKFVNQGKAVNKIATKSGYITLHENRTVTGSDKGSWFPNGGDSISLMLESGSYFGVMKWQWDNALKQLVPVFSALANDGSTVFGSRSRTISETADAVRATTNALEIKSEMTELDDGYVLPTVGNSGTLISWESSNEYFIDDKVFIPTPDLGDQVISLTATMSLNGQTSKKTFSTTLKARPEFKNAIAHYKFDNTLVDALGNLTAAQTTDRTLMGVGLGTMAYATGKQGDGLIFDGESGVRLPNDLIKQSQYTISFWVNNAESRIHTPAFYAARNPDNWLSYIPANAWFTTQQLIWSNYAGTSAAEFGAWNQIIAAATAPLNQWQHVAITYDAPVMTLFINGGVVGQMNRADIFSGGGGDFALGVNYGADAPFKGKIDELIVYDYPLGVLDINGAAINNLTDESQFPAFVKDALELGDLSAVRENFELVRVGPFVSGISWTSSDTSVLNPVNGTAVVTQPKADEGDKTVTLTAHIAYKDFTDTKTFEVTVKSLAPAEFSFDGNLSAHNNAVDDGKVTGDRISNSNGAVSYVGGVKGQAVYLDGTSGIRLPDNLITTNSYAISLWLKPEIFTNYTAAFFGGASANIWLSLVPSMNGTNKTRVWANSPGGFYDGAELSNRLADNEWSHVVIVVDSENNNTIKMYINGELKHEANGFPRVMTVAGETNEFALGVNYWDIPYKGAIDELKVYTGTISTEKINSLYQEGLPANQ